SARWIVRLRVFPDDTAARRRSLDFSARDGGTAAAIRDIMAPDTRSDRWYERIIRRTQSLRPDEERALVAALEAHRDVVVKDVLASPLGLAYPPELRTRLATRALDVRAVVEMDADVRVEDALATTLGQLERVATLAATRGARGRARTDLAEAI